MKLFLIFLLIFLFGNSFQNISVPEIDSKINNNPRNLRLDDSDIEETEQMNEQISLFEEMENPDNENETVKQELEYFSEEDSPKSITVNQSPKITLQADTIISNPEEIKEGLTDDNGKRLKKDKNDKPSIELQKDTIIKTPDDVKYGAVNEKGEPLEKETNKTKPNIFSEIEETHTYLFEHNLVLDLHGEHLKVSYLNLANLEKQFAELIQELNENTKTYTIDANTQNLLKNFVEHLTFIDHESKFEYNEVQPLLYDYYLQKPIDFEEISKKINLKEEDYKSEREKIHELDFGHKEKFHMTSGFDLLQKLKHSDHPQLKSQQYKSNENGSSFWFASENSKKSPDVMNSEKKYQNRFVSSRNLRLVDNSHSHHHHHHMHHDRQNEGFNGLSSNNNAKLSNFLEENKHSRKTSLKTKYESFHKHGNRKDLLVETTSGFQYPQHNGRNPWSKTRFGNYVRPVLQENFDIYDVAEINQNIDELGVYYNSIYDLLLEVDELNEKPEVKIKTDIHVYKKVKDFSSVAYSVLEQIWNDLNQIMTLFQTIPSTHLNTISFFNLTQEYDALKCKCANMTNLKEDFEKEVLANHDIFRKRLSGITAKIEVCEDDVYSILDITEFYRNYKGEENMEKPSPEFKEFVKSSQKDFELLKQIKPVAKKTIAELKLEIQKMTLVRVVFQNTFGKYRMLAGAFVIAIKFSLFASVFLFFS